PEPSGARDVPIVLTIAGSDSGGGAGIQADLKTFAMLGVWGTSAITSITVQNTQGVSDVSDVPARIVGAQIRAVDLGSDDSGGNVRHVADALGVLDRDRRDRAGPPHPEHGEGLQVRLDPRAASRVRPGDGQHNGNVPSAGRLR